MKRVAGSIGFTLLLLFAAVTTGCTKDAAVADASAEGASSPSTETLVLPIGTRFLAKLGTSLSTDSNRDGDAFMASTVEPIVVDGRMVVPAGSRVDGVLRDVQASGRIKNRARMTLLFQEIEDSAGRTHSMSTLPLTIQAASETHHDPLKIAGGAGTVLVLATKDDDVALDPGLELHVELTGPTSFMVTRR